MKETSLNQYPLPLKEKSGAQKLGAYLRLLRRELGFSLRYVASRSGISHGYLSKIENGTITKTIGIETIIALASVYRIPVDVMLEEAGLTESSSQQLPELGVYLRVKYKLPPQAVRDMEIAREIIEKKYKSKYKSA